MIKTVGELRKALDGYSDDTPLYGYNGSDREPPIDVYPTEFEKDEITDEDGHLLRDGLTIDVSH